MASLAVIRPRRKTAFLAVAAGVVLWLQKLRRKKVGAQAQGQNSRCDTRSSRKNSRSQTDQDSDGHSWNMDDCVWSMWLWLHPEASRVLASCRESWFALTKDLGPWYTWMRRLSRGICQNSAPMHMPIHDGSRCDHEESLSTDYAAHDQRLSHEQWSYSDSQGSPSHEQSIPTHEQRGHSHAFGHPLVGRPHRDLDDDSLEAHACESKPCVRRWQRGCFSGHDATTLAPIADETSSSTAGQTSTSSDPITDETDPSTRTDETDPSTAGQSTRRLDFVSDETDTLTAGDETCPSLVGQTITSLAPIPDETGGARSGPAQLLNKKLRILGFERVMKGTPPLVKSELLCSPHSTSARSARSETSQRIINDLQAQIAKLKEEVSQESQTPRSARSEKSQRVIDDLHAQIARLTAEGENSLPPRSARSELLSARSQASARSTRSDTSHRIIYDLNVQIMKLKEELAQASKTPRSARSDKSQRIINDLNAEIARLTEKENSQTPRSARSDASQCIINDLQAQIAAMKAERDPQSVTSAGPDPAAERANDALMKACLMVQIATPREMAPASDEHPAAAAALCPERTTPAEPEMLHCFKPEGLSSAPYVRILAYGDGLTAGYSTLDSYGAKEFASYGQQLVESLAPKVAVELWVCGLSAATAAQLADEAESGPIIDVAGKPGVGMKAALTMHGPFDLVLIMLGTNDLANTELQSHRPALVMASKIFENIERIHTVCHERNTPTVVLSVPESRHYRLGLENDMDAHYVDCWRHLNASLQKWSVENRDMVKLFIDTGEAMPWSRGSECWECDGIYFSIAGCRHLGGMVAEAVLPVIMKIQRTREPAGGIDFWQLPMELWTPLPDPERLSKRHVY